LNSTESRRSQSTCLNGSSKCFKIHDPLLGFVNQYPLKSSRSVETIGVFGLGFVGSSIAAVWLRYGATVVGYDVSTQRIDDIKNQRLGGFDSEVEEALRKGIQSGKLVLTSDGVEASINSRIKFVCVPVYLGNDGKADLSYLKSACVILGKGLRRGDSVIICPSAPPGTTRDLVAKVLAKESKLKAGEDFSLIYSPERIFVGRAVKDLEENYPAVVSGIDERSLAKAEEIYGKISKKGSVKMPSLESAEFEKLAEGVYRDVNIALANELAMVCDELGIDYFSIREAANSQPYSNLHVPGFGVGGACIPVYPLLVKQSVNKTKTSIISESRRINDSMTNWLVDALKKEFHVNESTRIGILGLSFRGGIADSRLSVTYKLVDNLKMKGLANIRVHDPLIHNDEVIGPILTSDLRSVIRWSDIAIIVTDHKEYKDFDWRRVKKHLRLIDGKGLLRGRNSENNIELYGLGYGSKRPKVTEQ